jgi:GT2 family glycosyltransferase
VVTAVVVSHDGKRWLPGVIQGLISQRRPVQQIVAVDTGSRDDSPELLAEVIGEDAVLRRKRGTGYGAAISYGLKASPPVAYDAFGPGQEQPIEWIWLLHDDSEPDTDALLHLLAVADEDPDAAVVGPKVRGWYDRAQLLESGISIGADGRRWTGLERNEHDQGQHDDVRPVLAVGSAGMLVRRDVWDRLRGFDTALPLFRDDVDFCWRANAAGFRVLRAPRAIVYHAEASARERRRIHAGVDRPHLLDRRNALNTVMFNKPDGIALFTYIRLIIGSVVRVLGLLIGKQAGTASDEFLALLAFATRPDRLLRGRSVRKRTRVVGGEAMADLFPTRAARVRQSIDEIFVSLRGEQVGGEAATSGRHRSAETGPVSEEAEALELDNAGWVARMLRQPVLLVLVSLLILTLISCRSLLVGGRLSGGALLPAPDGAVDLWSQFASAWHPVGSGTSTASPPYLGIMAVLSSILFGKPELAVDLVIIGAVPLSGLTAYYAVRRIVGSNLLRVWGAVAYALLPVATGAIAAGRIGTAVATVLLPLITVGFVSTVGTPRRAGSVRSAWSTAFGLAIATAFAPMTWLLALVAAAIAVGAAFRAKGNTVGAIIRLGIVLATPLIVLAPWSLGLIDEPKRFLLEPGATGAGLADPRLSPIHLLLGNPGGPGTYPVWLTIGLLLGAFAGLLRRSRREIVVAAWGLALLGFGIGVVASRTTVISPSTGGPVTPWPGIAATALGFGLVIATLIGAEGARARIAESSFGWRQPVTLLVTALAGLAPVLAAGWWIWVGAAGPLERTTPDPLPAYVVAEDQTSADRPRTLVLGVGADGLIAYGIVRAGVSLGDADLTPYDSSTKAMNGIVGGLLAGVGGDEASELAQHDIKYVVVTKQAQPLLDRNLDGTAGLERLSDNDNMALWQISYSAARLTLVTPAQPATASSGKSSGSKSSGSTSSAPAKPASTVALPSGVTSAHATIPAGPDDRTLVLAEPTNSHWTATLDGQALTPTTVDGWAQGFEVPATGGRLALSYHDPFHWVEIAVEGLLMLIALVMALPTGRQLDQTEGEEEAERAAAVGAQPRRENESVAGVDVAQDAAGEPSGEVGDDREPDRDDAGAPRAYGQVPPQFDRSRYDAPSYDAEPAEVASYGASQARYDEGDRGYGDRGYGADAGGPPLPPAEPAPQRSYEQTSYEQPYIDQPYVEQGYDQNYGEQHHGGYEQQDYDGGAGYPQQEYGSGSYGTTDYAGQSGYHAQPGYENAGYDAAGYEQPAGYGQSPDEAAGYGARGYGQAEPAMPTMPTTGYPPQESGAGYYGDPYQQEYGYDQRPPAAQQQYGTEYPSGYGDAYGAPPPAYGEGYQDYGGYQQPYPPVQEGQVGYGATGGCGDDEQEGRR